MKIRFTQFVLVSWFILVSEHPIWSQSTLYFDRGNFINACQTVPGNQQAIDFLFVPPFDGHPTVTVANVTFTDRSLTRNHAVGKGVSLLIGKPV